MRLKKHVLSFIVALAVTFMALESAMAIEAPDNFTATVDGNKVTLTWDAASGATGYKLHYRIAKFTEAYDDSIDVGNVTSRIFENVPKWTYYVAVTSYDGLVESSFSDEADFTIYEPDDTVEQANIIILNDLKLQKHNFHDVEDQDWVKFYAKSGEWYHIEALNVSAVTDVVIELYDTDGTTLLEIRNKWVLGKEEVLSWRCPIDGDGVYFVKFRNYKPDDFGANFTYEANVYVPEMIFPGTIVGQVTDGISPLEGAILYSNIPISGTAITFPDGAYIMNVPAATHNITCRFEGFMDTIVPGVTVHAGDLLERNISMTPVDLQNPVIDIKANGSDGPVTIQHSENLTITISLDSKDMLGKNSDWWMTAKTLFAPPDDRYYYDLNTDWTPGLSFTHQGPLFDLPLFEVLNMSGLPAGTYIFTFEVDTNMNGVKDIPSYSGSVTVNVQ